jgi:hypothetical protein
LSHRDVFAEESWFLYERTLLENELVDLVEVLLAWGHAFSETVVNWSMVLVIFYLLLAFLVL